MSEEKIEREHFAFLRSYWEQIKLLPSKKQKCEVFEAILSVQFFENEINSISFSNQNQMILWEGLKPILKQSQKGYLDKMGLQGSNPRQGSSKGPSPHKDKDEDEDKDFEREGEGSDNIFFHLYGSEKKKEIDKFIKYLIDNQEYVKSETAFKMKVKKKLDEKDKFQLEEFEKWYLEYTCIEFKNKYVGKYKEGDLIQSIYSYFNTDGYDSYNKYIVWLISSDTNNGYAECFEDKDSLESFLDEVTDGTI